MGKKPERDPRDYPYDAMGDWSEVEKKPEPSGIPVADGGREQSGVAGDVAKPRLP